MLEVNVFSFMIGREMVSVHHLILHQGGPQYTLSITPYLNRQMMIFLLAAPLMVYLSVGIGMLFEISLGPWNKDILAGLASGSRQLG